MTAPMGIFLFSPNFFLTNSQDHFTLWTKMQPSSGFGILIAANWNNLDVLQDSHCLPQPVSPITSQTSGVLWEPEQPFGPFYDVGFDME